MIDADALSPEKRTQILQGAAIVFAQDGYEGASMSRIARESNVSKGTLYNHFESKAELFRAAPGTGLPPPRSPIIFDKPVDRGRRPGPRPCAASAVASSPWLLSPERRAIHRMVISESESFPELARTFYESGPRSRRRRLVEMDCAPQCRSRPPRHPPIHRIRRRTVFRPVPDPPLAPLPASACRTSPSEAEIDLRSWTGAVDDLPRPLPDAPQ